MFVQRESDKLKTTKFMLAYVFDFPTRIIVNVGVINGTYDVEISTGYLVVRSQEAGIMNGCSLN